MQGGCAGWVWTGLGVQSCVCKTGLGVLKGAVVQTWYGMVCRTGLGIQESIVQGGVQGWCVQTCCEALCPCRYPSSSGPSTLGFGAGRPETWHCWACYKHPQI